MPCAATSSRAEPRKAGHFRAKIRPPASVAAPPIATVIGAPTRRSRDQEHEIEDPEGLRVSKPGVREPGQVEHDEPAPRGEGREEQEIRESVDSRSAESETVAVVEPVNARKQHPGGETGDDQREDRDVLGLECPDEDELDDREREQSRQRVGGDEGGMRAKPATVE